MMSADKSMPTYYAKRAQEYERIYQKPERQDDLRRLREFVARSLAGRHVLEIACGTGYWTEILSRSAASVAAIDINDEVLEIARGKALDPERVRFQKADVYALPPFSQRFDGLFAAFWWSHVPKSRLREFVSGLHPFLAPDAHIVMIDNRYVEGSSTPIARMDAAGNTYQTRKLDDGSTYEVLKNFPTEPELAQTLAGLADNIRIEFLEYYWTMAYAPMPSSNEPAAILKQRLSRT
jgi:SAM-dependent methyltransferase